MKRITSIVAAALVAALAAGAVAGCSSQPASSATASGSASASASAAEQSQDAIIAELKSAVANEPAYKSVTLTELSKATFFNVPEAVETDASASSDSADSEAAASGEAASSESASADEATSDETIESKAVYKFDESGDKLKTSMTAEIEGITLQYYSDGEDAVCVTDGPVYSGTTAQFDSTHFNGVAAYLKDATGDLNTVIDCAATVTKEQQDDVTVYTLTLDPEKYIKSDEILSLMAENGDSVVEAVFALGFDQEGHIVSIHKVITYVANASDLTLTLSDFDSTVVEPMPEADKTYEEMEADIDAKFEALYDELDLTSEFQNEAK